MDAIRILYITKLSPKKTNGVTVAVTQLLNAICKDCETAWLDLGGNDIDIDERVLRVRVNDWQEFNPDIAIFEDPFNSLQFCKIASRLREKGIPYILSPHGCLEKSALHKKALKKYLAINTVLRGFLRGCTATQFLCENERKNSIQFGNSIVIPNGIPQNDEYKKVQTIKRIVFIGRKDVRHKGIDYLLEAILTQKNLMQSMGAKLDLYGPDESSADEKYINQFIIKKGLSEIVRNYGPVFGEEKKNILTGADLFVLTSRHEGFSIAVLEALSYGVPVLVTKGTNVAEIIENAQAGWGCASNSGAVASALKRALECADCSTISKNARDISLQYSWESISRLTIEKYFQIVRDYRKN